MCNRDGLKALNFIEGTVRFYIKGGNKMKKALSLILALALTCSLFASCTNEPAASGSSAEPESSSAESSGSEESTGETGTEDISGNIQYAFWGDELERQQKEEFCASFSDLYPDATVEFMHIPSDYYLKLQTLAAANDLPDVFGVTSQNVALMAPVAMTLDSFMEKYPDLIANIPQAVLDAGKYDGSYYMLINGLDPYGMAINKDIFEDAGVPIPEDGWTMDDLEALLPQLTKVDESTGRTQYYALAVTVYNCDYYNFIGNFGGTFFENDQSTWSSNQGVKDAITMLTNACLNGYAPSPAITTSSGLDNERLFITGQIAMFPGGFWTINSFYGQDNSQIEFEWDFIDMPVQEGVDPVDSFVPGGNMASKDTEYPEVVNAFLAYTLTKEGVMGSYEAGLSLPVTKDLHDASLVPYGEYLTLDYFYRAADYIFPQSALDLNNSGNASECISIMNAELQLCYDGQQTVEQTLQNIDDKVNEIVNRDE